MLKKTLFVVGAAIAVATVSAQPASANANARRAQQTQQVPEPVTVIGSIAAGAGLLSAKLKASKSK
ncbi:MAG: hypothetical protein AAGD25_39480 [Cyanobacteria bacterium P01_F01_bin.150]